VKVLLFIIILAANGYFLLSWARQVLPLLFEVIKRKLAKYTKNYRVSPIVRKTVNSDQLFGSSDISGESKGTRPVGHEFDQFESSISQAYATPISGEGPSNTPCSVEQSQADQSGPIPESSIDWS
jgi:hypothetical protein